MARERLNDSQLRGLAEVLGETREGLSNSEIDRLLVEAGIEDPRAAAPSGTYVVMSKKDRLFEAWRRRQANDRSPNAVLRCLEITMQPVRFAGKHDLFDRWQSELSERLIHSGMRVTDSGTITPTEKATTVSEARIRTRRLRAKLEDRSAHAKVLVACDQEIRDENYFHIVLEASKSLADEVRRLAEVDADGTSLINLAFKREGGKLPCVAWNKLETRTDRSEHDGLTNLARGVVGGFRNPTAHEPKISWEVSELDALDVCSTISLLHRRLERATRVPDALRDD